MAATDRLGRSNTSVRLDAAGSVLSSHAADAFGGTVTLPTVGGADDPYAGYGAQWGYYRDAETGLYLCTFRYYDAIEGRWLTPDPIGYAGGVNVYGYVTNGPTAWSDPLGLKGQTPILPYQKLNSGAAFKHYIGGTGAPVRISFADVYTGDVLAANFPQVKKALENRSARTVNISDRMPYQTRNDESLVLGRITLKLEGKLHIKADCTWEFIGILKAFDDYYDFNGSDRGPIAEFLTLIGRKTPGKAYDIQIRGSKIRHEQGVLGSKRWFGIW